MQYISKSTLYECIKNCRELIDILEEILIKGISLKQVCITRSLDITRTRRLIDAMLRMHKTEDSSYDAYVHLQNLENCHLLFDGYEKLYQCIFQIPENTFFITKLPCDYRESIDFLLGRLDKRQKEVLVRHFGLQGHEEESLRKIRTSLNLSAEGVRLIEVKAIRNLKENNGLQILRIGLCLYRIEEEHRQEIQEQQIAFVKQTHRTAIEKIKKMVINGSNVSLYDFFQSLPIETLQLSVRSQNCLKRSHIYTIFDLLCYDTDLLGIRGLGKTSKQEILSNLNLFLADYNLSKEVFMFLYREQLKTAKEAIS